MNALGRFTATIALFDLSSGSTLTCGNANHRMQLTHAETDQVGSPPTRTDRCESHTVRP